MTKAIRGTGMVVEGECPCCGEDIYYSGEYRDTFTCPYCEESIPEECIRVIK